jgi:hypothetical protein
MSLAEETLRHYCRRCRLKLSAPTENERSAFCCRGCFRMYYAKRCIVCERPKSNERRLVCSRPECRSGYAELKRYDVLGKWAGQPKWAGRAMGSARVHDRSAEPIKIGVCEPVEAARPWRQVAGPALTAEQLHLAAVGRHP